MIGGQGIPLSAAQAIDDMLENCARLQKNQEVLILACVDGLYGGDNLVDAQAVAWIQQAVQAKGANASVLWIDEPTRPHAWRLPPIVKGAVKSCDVLINNSFNIVVEELVEFRELFEGPHPVLVRNFATTAPLLCTPWANTPHELVSEIRYQASLPFEQAGARFRLSDENGTFIEGTIGACTFSFFPRYSTRRHEAGGYRPWPEWVIPPITIENTSGVVVFDRMLSWWPRYIGISPYLESPIRMNIANGRITKIEGGREADALSRFLKEMVGRLGERVYDFTGIHCGVHPRAKVEPHQCPSAAYRRLIEHCDACNIHFHIGAPPPAKGYNYWMHVTGDIRTATWKVGDTLIHDRGHLTFLDHPAVRAVAAKYPGRPGV